MRYGVFSDIHSNLQALEAVLEAYKKESIDLYLCAGDIVGYAANPKECIKKVRSLAYKTVAGNHDWATVEKLGSSYFNPFAYKAILWTKDNISQEDKAYLDSLDLIFENEDLVMVHGSLNKPEIFDYLLDDFAAKQNFSLMKKKVCFVGHSHIAGSFVQNSEGKIFYTDSEIIDLDGSSRFIINVGSIGQPRDGNPKASYCIYDTDSKSVVIKRIDYPVSEAGLSIISAGLPKFLADRIAVGR